MLDVSIVIPVLCKCCSGVVAYSLPYLFLFLVDSLMETEENPVWLVPVSPVVRYESNARIAGFLSAGQPGIVLAGN